MSLPDQFPDQPSLLRVATCGSIDDGKSSLIGRLLFEVGALGDDTLPGLARDSRARQVGPEGFDLSLVVDGLAAEREQGITIDVGYRYFSTTRRAFILADSPGHQQYTRNMATAASQASAAIVVLDVRKGILAQTKRHLAILSLMRVRHVACAINKVDLIGWDETRYREVEASLRDHTAQFGFESLSIIPTSALHGDNVVRRADRLRWYNGPTILDWLESVPHSAAEANGLCMPVQWVNRGTPDFRGLAGSIVAGQLRTGDTVKLLLSGKITSVVRIFGLDANCDVANAGMPVTVVLSEPLDVGRGDIICDPFNAPDLTDRYVASIVWFGTESMVPGRAYFIKLGASLVSGEIARLDHRFESEAGETHAANALAENEIGLVNLRLSQPIGMMPYKLCRGLGSFVIIDKISCATVGAGVVEQPLARTTNIHIHQFDVTPARRAAAKHQRPMVVWFTGLSGAGKSTIANLVERQLHAHNIHTMLLDGDNVRSRLNRDLSFDVTDRLENVRRVAEVARLMADSGLVVLVALISPFHRERAMARDIIADYEFLEIFVDAPLAVCEARDSKGLYARARAGSIADFTGVSSPYEPPEAADLVIESDRYGAEACAAQVFDLVMKRQQERQPF